MASALSSAINNVKYADMKVNNGGTWTSAKEVWVNNGSWVEPKEIWANDGGTWKRVTTQLRYIKFNGSSSQLNCGSYFNCYIDGTTTCYYEFTFILTSIASVQTLFSYGTDATYFTIEVGTDGKVYVRSRFDSGTLRVVTHATVLSLNTIYLVRVEANSDVTIRLRSYTGATIGTDISGILGASINTTTKYIGMKYNSSNYFSGYLLDINMFGGTYGGTDYRHDANSLLSSTIGSTTVTDSYTTDGSQNLSGSNLSIAVTG